MKVFGRLLVVTALLFGVIATLGTNSAGAATSTVQYPAFNCVTYIGALEVFAPYNLSVSVEAPDTVTTGQPAPFSVVITGLTNAGFADFNSGSAQADMRVNGVAVTSAIVAIPNTGKNQPIVIPAMTGTTGPITEATTITVERVRYWNAAATSSCTFPAANRATVSVLAQGPTSSTQNPPSTTTVTATPNPAVHPATVALSATVASNGSPVNGGTVTFFDGVADGSPNLGSAPVTGGVATLPTVALTTGVHQILAKFSGTDTVQPSQAVGSATVDKAGQTITFPALPNIAEGDPPVALGATASSGLPVSYTAAGACTISGNTAVPAGAGSCTVTATQAGNENYNAAEPAKATFTITAAPDPDPGGGTGGDGGTGGGSTTAKLVSTTAAVEYQCAIRYSGVSLDQTQTLTVKLSAPDKATIGTKYKVFMDVTPGVQTDVPLAAGIIEGMTSTILVSAPGSPTSLVTNQPTNAADIPGGGYVTFVQSTGEVLAGGAEGAKVTITPGVLKVPTKAQNGGAGGSVTCTPKAGASLATVMTTATVEQPGGTPTPPPAPPATTTTAPPAPAPTVAPATTAAPAGPAVVQAQVISRSAQVEYECKIYSGSNLVTTQKSTQTVTIETLDKVAPGGTLNFKMTISPGPKNGPIPFPAGGVQNLTTSVGVGGDGSPSTVSMNLGTVAAAVPADANIPVPTSSGSVQVTGQTGGTITLTPSAMKFETTRPPSRTECTATNAAVLTTTEIVEGVEVAGATATRLAVTGGSRSWLLWMAVAQLLLGAALVLLPRRRRVPA